MRAACRRPSWPCGRDRGKAIELLHRLLMRPSEAVTKGELLDAVWPDVSVVDASVAAAVLKLQRALADTEKDSPIIETVPRIGYRLAAPTPVSSPS